MGRRGGSSVWTNIFITDSKIREILIVIQSPVGYPNDGFWSLNKQYLGWLAVNEGTSYYHEPKNTFYLLGPDKTWGIMLNNYKSQSGYVNMEGSYGTILQPWVLAFESGDIAWDARHGHVHL